ncbi:hypothetical protein D3C77_639040 [compost metagenome]
MAFHSQFNNTDHITRILCWHRRLPSLTYGIRKLPVEHLIASKHRLNRTGKGKTADICRQLAELIFSIPTPMLVARTQPFSKLRFLRVKSMLDKTSPISVQNKSRTLLTNQ